MLQDISEVGKKAGEILTSWAQVYAAIQTAKVDVTTAGSNISGLTIAEASQRIAQALGVAARLQDVAPEQGASIAHRASAIGTALENIRNQVNSILANIELQADADSATVNNALHIQFNNPAKGNPAFDLGAPMAAILAQCVTLFDFEPAIAGVLGDAATPLFGSIVNSIGDQLSEAKESASAAGKELGKTKKIAEQQKALADNSQAVVQQIEALLSAAAIQKSSIDSGAAEIEQKLARAREISKDADALQQRVDGFTAQFEAFETQMKARLTQFADFEHAITESRKLNDERELSIDELTVKADTMIRGATTAGLSKSLDDAKDFYEKRLNITQRYFLLSVTFLLFCTLPIAAQFMPGPWQASFAPQPNGALTDTAPWLAALGKLMLLIPATWATAFFAGNYAELFHLSREYAHKAALAKAIDGFKREAPTYAEEIVSSVFMEIQDNPGTRKAPATATPQNPVAEKFFDKVMLAIQTLRGKPSE